MRLIEIANPIPAQYQSVIDEYIQNGKYIYRGIATTEPFFVQDGSTMNREPSDPMAPNILNRLTSVVPSWKGWPPRNKSFCCANKPSIAFSYVSRATRNHEPAAIYHVIPLENQPIAVAQTSDFWSSIDYLSKKLIGVPGLTFFSIDYSLQKLINISHSIHGTTMIDRTSSVNKVITALHETHTAMKHDDGQMLETFNNKKVKYYDLCFNNLKNSNNIIDFINEGIDPIKNGNKLYNNYTEGQELGNYNTYSAGKEVWLTGKVLFVNEYIIRSFKGTQNETL